ncbi:LysR family transcriptional regulator [Streptomyces fradiae]|uniref:LysR family transcriptional regulator n=1 Tax=Streptomyces fradiae TaxID=1906 RepID=UPI00351670E1
MDPHLLRTYVTVARLGSFSAAARELGYTQSAVSQHIAALEADLGLALLGRRPVAPTPAGERLLEHAGSLLLRLDAARADLARYAAPPRRTLTLAAAPLTALVVAEEPLVVVLPAGHPLAGRRDGLDLGDLVDARWLDAPGAGLPLDRLRAAQGAPGGHGFRPSLRYEGTDVRTVAALAAAGHGLALLPRSAAASGPGAVLVPLAAPRLVHRTELLHGGLPHGGEPDGPAAELLGRLGHRETAAR